MRTIKLVTVPKGGWIGLAALALLNEVLWIGLPFLPSDRSGTPTSTAGFVFSWTIAFFWLVMTGIAVRQSRMLQGLGAYVDEEGVGPLVDGEPTWRLDWADFGGAERVEQSTWGNIKDPRKAGIRIFDRQGAPLAVLPIRAPRLCSNSTKRTGLIEGIRRRMFIEALNNHAPEGSPKIEPNPPPKRMTIKAAAVTLSIGVLILIGSVWLGAASLEAVRENSAGFLRSGWSAGLMMLLGVSGIVCIFAGGGDFYVRKRGKSFVAAAPLPHPEEGPHIDEHLLEMGSSGKRIELEDGVRYRVVHPEAFAPKLKESMATIKVLEWMSAAIVAMLVLIAASNWKPEDLVPLILGSVFFGGLGVLPRLSLPIYSQALESLGDTIVKDGDQLLVIKPDGSRLRFGPNARWRKLVLSSPLEEVRENEVRYYLDRTRLYASERTRGD